MKMFVCIIVRSGGSWVRAVIWVAYNNFPTNRKCSGSFYGLSAVTVSGIYGLVAPEPSSQIADMETCIYISAGLGYLFPVPVGFLFSVRFLHPG